MEILGHILSVIVITGATLAFFGILLLGLESVFNLERGSKVIKRWSIVIVILSCSNSGLKFYLDYKTTHKNNIIISNDWFTEQGDTLVVIKKQNGAAIRKLEDHINKIEHYNPELDYEK